MFVKISLLMTLSEFIFLIRRNFILIFIISLVSATGAFFYSNKNTNRVSLIVKCYPHEDYIKEIKHVAPNIKDLFKTSAEIENDSLNFLIKEFKNNFNIVGVGFQKSSIDKLNIWFKIYLKKEEDNDYAVVANKFINLMNEILLNRTVISDKVIEKNIKLIKPIFPDVPYSDITLKKVNPLKGAIIVFITSFIFLGLFFAFLNDLKMNSKKN